jgi:hypothetical protein
MARISCAVILAIFASLAVPTATAADPAKKEDAALERAMRRLAAMPGDRPALSRSCSAVIRYGCTA